MNDERHVEKSCLGPVWPWRVLSRHRDPYSRAGVKGYLLCQMANGATCRGGGAFRTQPPPLPSFLFWAPAAAFHFFLYLCMLYIHFSSRRFHPFSLLVACFSFWCRKLCALCGPFSLFSLPHSILCTSSHFFFFGAIFFAAATAVAAALAPPFFFFPLPFSAAA